MTDIIQENFKNRNEIFNTLNSNFKKLQITQLLKQSNFNKERGFLVTSVFRYIFLLVFSGKNLYRTFNSNEKHLFGKDVVYRFLNSPRHNWQKFLFLLSSMIIQKILSTLYCIVSVITLLRQRM